MSYAWTAANSHKMERASFAAYTHTSSVIAWAKVKADSVNRCICNWDHATSSATDRVSMIQNAAEEFLTNWTGSGTPLYGSTGTLSDATWYMYHWRSVSSTEAYQGYNGNDIEQRDAGTLTFVNTPNRFRVGFRTNDTYWDSKIAHIAVYSVTLSATQLAQLLTCAPSDASLSYGSCIAYWDFRTNRGAGVAVDDSKASYDLTLSGGTGYPVWDSEEPTFFPAGSPLILPHRSNGGMIDLSGNFRG